MTFGYPVFIFNYILQYYVIAAFHFIGLSFINSMKIFLAFSFIASGVFMYIFTRKIFKNELQAFAASVFYLFTPYHLVVYHFRVNGEILGFAFMPLILIFVENLLKKPNLRDTLLAGLFYGLFYLAHSSSAVFFLPIVFLYSLVSIIKSKKEYFKKAAHITTSLVIGIFLASYVFVAHVILGQYTYTSVYKGTGVTYQNILELIYSPWRYGFLFQGHKGELSFIVGYTQLFVIFGLIFFLLKKKINKADRPFVILWLFLFFGLSFLITPWSDFLWKAIPLLSIAQFAYRLLLIVTLVSSILAGYFFLHIKNKNYAYLLIFITIAYTILNWGNRGTIPLNDNYLIKNVPNSTLEGEGMAIMASPKWLKEGYLWEKAIPKNQLEVLSGNAEIKEALRQQTLHNYQVEVESNAVFKENTLYFPGWNVKVDGQKIPINYLDGKNLGKILFKVPEGNHSISVYYEDIALYKLSKQLSAFGYGLIMIILSIMLIKKMKLAKK
ncbi:MAG: glycosyltransferase family 39 protein [Actinobacteria bacterium]|nr:glycosyltransferase family 39 protein [Actinomycetota bacterium]